MPHENTVLHEVLKELPRREIARLVAAGGHDRGVRRLPGQGHLIAMIVAQLSGACSLRDLEARLAAQRSRLYHLGAVPVRRSTLADANAVRSPALFEAVAQLLLAGCGQVLGRRERAEAGSLIRLLDSTLVKLGPQRSSWAQCWTPGFAAAKLHLAWAPRDHLPVRWAVTAAAESDVGVAKTWPIEPDATYIFDRGYCEYAWWAVLDGAGALFVTRRKAKQAVHEVRQLPVPAEAGITSDRIVTLNPRLAKSRRNPLDRELREVTLTLGDGRVIQLLTNDLARSAQEIAALYKERWQIELVFKWLKQTLKIKRPLGTSKNAVHLQILSALIAFLLLRLVAARNRFQGSLMSFARLVGTSLMERRTIAALLHPPDPAGQSTHAAQLAFPT